jgi:hypothetical protein
MGYSSFPEESPTPWNRRGHSHAAAWGADAGAGEDGRGHETG